MDKPELERILEALETVSPELASFAKSKSAGKWVLLIEACNHGAKRANARFKQERDAFRAANPGAKGPIPPEIKSWDTIGGTLMGAAKNCLLSLALADGAKAYAAKDDKGTDVLILEHPEAGRVALHGVNPQKIDPAVSGQVIREPQTQFTGFRRQTLSEEYARACAQPGDILPKAIVLASMDKSFATAVHKALGCENDPESAAQRSVSDVVHALRKVYEVYTPTPSL